MRPATRKILKFHNVRDHEVFTVGCDIHKTFMNLCKNSPNK